MAQFSEMQRCDTVPTMILISINTCILRCPEVVLAREAEICFSTIAMITDYDVWAAKPVSTEEVVHTMTSNVQNFQKLIMETIPKIPTHRICSCGQALQGALI